MAEGKKETAEGASGLVPTMVAQLHAALVGDGRIKEAKGAARANMRADIGLIVRSKRKFFFRPDGEPVVPGFSPAAIYEGSWEASNTLSVADASRKQASHLGFVTACSVNLSAVPDVDAFLRRLLVEFGRVEIAPQFSPSLDRSVPYIHADPQILTDNGLCTTITGKVVPYDGRDVKLCVIDMGCDYTHRNFRTGPNLEQSRLIWLGVQKSDLTVTWYEKGTIEKWIADPSQSLYDPHDVDNNCVPDSMVSGTHGTLVLDIAAGNGNGTGLKGVAPSADLVFVQAYVSKTGGRRFIDAAAILKATIEVRDKLLLDGPNPPPTVFNISLGGNEGPHDSVNHGVSSWNLDMNSLFDGKLGRALVWSAGNQFGESLHVSGTIRRNNPATVDLQVARGDLRDNRLWFWLDKPSSVTLKVEAQLLNYKGAPNGYEPVGWQTSPLKDHPGARAAGTIGSALRYGTGSDTLHSIEVVVTPPAVRTPTVDADDRRWEIWRFRLSGDATAAYGKVPFHAWLQRDDGDQASFRSSNTLNCKVDPLGTLNSGAAGVASAIVVGAIGTANYDSADAKKASPPAGVGRTMPFSSAGPTRAAAAADDARRPDVCAPGEIIRGAKSLGDPVGTGTGYGMAATTAMSGTSMAAPHVAGLVALVFDKRKRAAAAYPTPTELRGLLKDSVQPNNPGGTTPQWDPQRGWGSVDAVALLKST